MNIINTKGPSHMTSTSLLGQVYTPAVSSGPGTNAVIGADY